MSAASGNKNALDVLMNRAKKTDGMSRKRPMISYFPCPSCGMQVTERDANDHLDRCLISSGDDNGAASSIAVVDRNETHRMHTINSTDIADSSTLFTEVETINEESMAKRGRSSSSSTRGPTSFQTPPANSNTTTNNAFSHMMKRSAAVFSKSGNGDDVIRQRFHLHTAQGLVTWTSEDVNGIDKNDASSTEKGGDTANDHANLKSSSSEKNSVNPSSVEEFHWSAVITMKKVKCVDVYDSPSKPQQTSIDNNDKALELTISSSLPFPQGDKKQNLVRRHSRLSVSHLKSCLQKSIRRRAPLPAVRVAMELADKSWGDLIRRLPIIVLEDSTLHPDFGLLVWLMVAESKGYFPCMPLLRRVMQIVLEIASCPRQDVLSGNESSLDDHKLPQSLSLKTSAAELFPDQLASEPASTCEMLIRSILLRAQYGGMKCDVQMLHEFATTWLKRFRCTNIPSSLACLTPETALGHINWVAFPRILHEKASQRSKEVITTTLVCPGGLLKLAAADVCHAGIDFHCSSVVEHLLYQRGLYASLSKRLGQPGKGNKGADRDWLSGKMKSLIWHHSSGINHRRLLFEREEKNEEDSISRAAWNDVLKTPFNEYTKKFVMDRLS